VGWLGEKMAALYLMKNDFEILKMNENCPPYGEIDIIANKKGCLHFVEVKTGLKVKENHLLEKFTHQKLSRLYASIQDYQMKNDIKGEVQLDAVTVKLQKGGPNIQYFPAITLD
jgi:putative endonuclease